MYSMSFIDNWRDLELVVDILLILLTIGADIYEIKFRGNEKGYHTGGNKTFLNIARVLRGFMIQRRASNFMQEVKAIVNSKTMMKKLKRKNSVTEMISEIMFYLGQDDK